MKVEKNRKRREKTTNVNNFKLVQRSRVCAACVYCYWVDKEMVFDGYNAMVLDTLLACVTFHFKIYIYPKKVIESLCTDNGDNNRPSTQSHSQIYCFFLCLVFAPKSENNVRLRQRHSRCECDSHCIINRLLLEKLWHLAKWTENESKYRNGLKLKIRRTKIRESERRIISCLWHFFASFRLITESRRHKSIKNRRHMFMSHKSYASASYAISIQ